MAFADRLVVRKEWHAREPKEITRISRWAIRYLVVHYSASNADEQANHANCAARVRGIQNFHMDSRGWNDIAYNWLVCKHGYVFRGRGIDARSAATGKANSFTLAVCFLGDDTKGRDDVTSEGRSAIRDVWKFVKLNCPHVEEVKGHRDFMATSCPGDELYKWIGTLNA